MAGETYQKTMGNVTFDAELDTHSLVTDFAYSNVICKAGKPNVDDWLALVKTRDPAIAASTEERVARSGETYSFVTLTGESGSGFYNENTGTFKYATLLGEQVNTMIAYYADSGADEILSWFGFVVFIHPRRHPFCEPTNAHVDGRTDL